MKKAFIYIVFVLFFLSFSQCTKEKIDVPIRNIATEVSERINDIYFIDQNIGIAVGGSRYTEGYILRTEDGGQNWVRIKSEDILLPADKTLQTLNSIDFYNDSLGQIVGHGGKILRTSDSGKTWEAIINGSWHNFYDIHLFSPDKTLIISGGAYSSGSVFSSEQFWYNFVKTDYTHALRDLFFIDDNIGFLAGYGFVQKTTDGGATWSILDLKTDYFFNMDFPSNNVGYISGWEGGIYKTTDQGETWQTINPNNKVFAKRQHYENIDFIDDDTGVVCGYNGEVLYTVNGGKTWKIIDTNTKENFHSIYFLNKTKAFVGGENGVLIELSFP